MGIYSNSSDVLLDTAWKVKENSVSLEDAEGISRGISTTLAL